MAINITGLSGVLGSLMYEDSMDVTSYGPTSNDDGSTDPNGEIIKVRGEPCKVSFTSLDGPDKSQPDRDKTHTIPKVICRPAINIHKGDTIKATKQGVVYEGQAGLPAVYSEHQEVLILQEGQA